MRVIFAAVSLLAATATALPYKNVDVFKAGDSVVVNATYTREYFCTKIPTILRTPSGDLLAWGEARVGSCADVAPTDLVYRRSADEGATWSELEIWHSDAENTVGNIAPVSVPKAGVIIAPFNLNNRQVAMKKSFDDGKTWTDAVIMDDMREDEWVWVGLGPPAGLVLQSGRILIPGYHNHNDFTDKSSLGSGFTKGHTMLSDDNGETWFLGNTEFGDDWFVNELQAAQLPDGRVVINSRVLSDKRVLSYSSDEGITFDNVKAADTLRQTFQGCEGSMIYHSGQDKLLYSGVQGRLPARIYRENMTIFESTDGGDSWSLSEIVDLGSSAYSAMVEVDKESVGILYERSTCEKGVFKKNKCPVIFLPEAISYRVVKL